MDDTLLAERFEAQRSRLVAVARRMLGSGAEAEDAVQEAWLRLSRQTRAADAAAIDNLDGWLTTVVARICLNVLQARRREVPLESGFGAGEDDASPGASSDSEVLLGDAIGAALLVVLDTLSPAERLAFVLHDLFGVPFEQVGEVLDKSPAAARQLASRARRRVQGAGRHPDDTPSADPGTGAPGGASSGSSGAQSSGAHRRRRQREVVDAFLSAAREGEFTRLLELLDPGAVLRIDEAAARMGAPAATGAEAVAQVFSGRAQAAELAELDGLAGLVWRQGDAVRVAFRFALDDAGRVCAIDMLAEPVALAALDVTVDRVVRP